jgi:hypothetical protein
MPVDVPRLNYPLMSAKVGEMSGIEKTRCKQPWCGSGKTAKRETCQHTCSCCCSTHWQINGSTAVLVCGTKTQQLAPSPQAAADTRADVCCCRTPNNKHPLARALTTFNSMKVEPRRLPLEHCTLPPHSPLLHAFAPFTYGGATAFTATCAAPSATPAWDSSQSVCQMRMVPSSEPEAYSLPSGPNLQQQQQQQQWS